MHIHCSLLGVVLNDDSGATGIQKSLNIAPARATKYHEAPTSARGYARQRTC